MANMQTGLEDLHGRFQELDRFRSSLQKLTDEFTSLRQSAETVLGRLREHDQFIDSRKDEVKQLMTAASGTIRTFEDRKEDLIHEIHTVLNQVQSSFNRLSGEIGGKAVDTINTTSLQIFQLRKSLLEFTEKKSEELRAALSSFESDLARLKAEHQEALANLPAVNEQIALVEDRLRETILSQKVATESVLEKLETRCRETSAGLERLDGRVADNQLQLEQAHREIEALGENREEVLRLLGTSHSKWEQLSAGHSELRGALQIIKSTLREYEGALASLRQEVEDGQRGSAEGLSLLSRDLGERIQEIEAEYRRHMGVMLARVESATQDTEQNIGVIRHEIESTLKESSDRISGFLISSEEKINDLKLNHYQTRAAVDRIERSQQETDKALSAARVEISESTRESRDLLSEFAAITNEKIDEMKSAYRREIEGLLSRLDTVRRESESALARTKLETERACRDRNDQMAALLKASEEKLDALRSDQVSMGRSLDEADRETRQQADMIAAALSAELTEALRRTTEEVAGLMQGADRGLGELRAEYHGLKACLDSLEHSSDEGKTALASLRHEVEVALKSCRETAEGRCDALASGHAMDLRALREELDEAGRQQEALAASLREQLRDAVEAAGRDKTGFVQQLELRLGELAALQDERIRSLSDMIEALRLDNESALASLRDQLAGSFTEKAEALASLLGAAGAKEEEIASERAELKGSLEALRDEAMETRVSVARIREEVDILRGEAADQVSGALRETQADLEDLRAECRRLADRSSDASKEAFTRGIDEVKAELSATRTDLSQAASASEDAIGALTEEIQRLRSEAASQMLSVLAEAEDRIKATRNDVLHEIESLLLRFDTLAREHGESLSALRRDLESAQAGNGERLSGLETAFRDHSARTSFERLQEVAALRDLIDRTRQDAARAAEALKGEVETSLSRGAGTLAGLERSTEERLNAAGAAYLDLTDICAGLRDALGRTDSDVAELKEHIARVAAETAKFQAEAAAVIEAGVNDAGAGLRSEVDALRRELAPLSGETAEVQRGLSEQRAELSSLRDEVRQSLEERPGVADELLNQLRAEYLKEITMVLDRLDSLHGEDRTALETMRQEIDGKIAAETGQLQALLRDTATQVSEVRAGTNVVNTLLDHVERLSEDHEKTKQVLRQALSEGRDEMTTALGATQETVELLKSRYFELQALMEGIENYRLESERAVAGFRQDIEEQLTRYLTDLSSQFSVSESEADGIRTAYRSIQEKVAQAAEENKRVQGELQDEIHYRTRETREQLTGLIERKTHQFQESFSTLVEHKDTMIRSALFSASGKQRNFTILAFLLSILVSVALFYFARR